MNGELVTLASSHLDNVINYTTRSILRLVISKLVITNTMSLKVDDKMPARPLPFLPVEVVLQIIPHIDPFSPEGRRTLLVFLHMSKACYRATIPTLYRCLDLDSAAIHYFFRHINTASSQPSRKPRACQYLRYAERVHLHSQSIYKQEVKLLYGAAAAEPGQVLFPNVTQLKITTSLGMRPVPSIFIEPPPPSNLLLFDRVDVCVQGRGSLCLLQHHLHIRKVVSLNIHQIISYSLFGPSLFLSYGNWEVINWYETDFEHFRSDCLSTGDTEEGLRRRGWGQVRVHLTHPEWKEVSLAGLAVCRDKWMPAPDNKMQLEWYDEVHPEGCPPCVICGE